MIARAHTLYALTLVAGCFAAGAALGERKVSPPSLYAKPAETVTPFHVSDGAEAQRQVQLRQEVPAQAQEPVQKAAQPFSLAADLDGLFRQLSRTGDDKRAERIANRIWESWRESDSRSIDLLAHWARIAMARKDYGSALDLLDQLVVLRPRYAEGYNTRATLHFMMENFGKSVRDIERTLALEPRHFGAMAGMASILERYERKRQALKMWYRVLAVYPANRNAQQAVLRLEEELAGEAI